MKSTVKQNRIKSNPSRAENGKKWNFPRNKVQMQEALENAACFALEEVQIQSAGAAWHMYLLAIASNED